MNNKSLIFRLPEKLKLKLDDYCEENSLTLAEALRLAIRVLLKTKSK